MKHKNSNAPAIRCGLYFSFTAVLVLAGIYLALHKDTQAKSPAIPEIVAHVYPKALQDDSPYPSDMKAMFPLMAAIRQAESSGNDYAVGDGGNSKGPYQIQRAYWQDACKYGGVKWDYNTHVNSSELCRWVIYWYMQRYCPEAVKNLDEERIARTHNGGCVGWSGDKAEEYWLEKIKPKPTKPIAITDMAAPWEGVNAK